MRKTRLRVTNQGVTSDALRDFVSGHGPARIGLRVAILQGIIDNAPVNELSRRHGISRQGIYDIVDRINKYGLQALEEGKRSGRPTKFTQDIRDSLKNALLRPPADLGYDQSRWDGHLVRDFLKEKHSVSIGRSQVNNWLHQIGFSLQRGRKKLIRPDRKGGKEEYQANEEYIFETKVAGNREA